ncbi:hypothetical protein H6P81_016799 [Aristolochia fimbriata]|uniref:Sel1-like protein n=1 Tax=Aristolochia fimbriata TaxID=158543 RepID=A0AAV7E9R0_ARIFI|nr:hypothetical protein H6P81_016799 [Aristolochia fimbriata]
MGKSLPSAAAHFQNIARITSGKLRRPPTSQKPKPKVQFPSELKASTDTLERGGQAMEGQVDRRSRVPLSEVVSDCVKRWFQDTLKEARAGDSAMQVLVGQMYYSGYGVPKDVQKGRAWITKASRTRSSVWKVSDKHPGYNASDSDSDELKVESK